MIDGAVRQADLWASYIIPSYILTVGGLVALLVWSWLSMRSAEKQSDRLKRK